MIRHLSPAVLLVLAAAPAAAQFPNLGSLGGGLLPGVSSASKGNAAGLLGYCVKRKLLGGTDAQGILGKLAGTPEVTGSKDYQAGQAGRVVTGNRQFSLDGVRDQVKGKVCSLVLDRAQSFVPG